MSDYPKIGNNEYKSETITVRPYLNQDKSVTYWDCPGFEDSRGVIFEIYTAFSIYALNSIINQYPNYSLLVVIEAPAINLEKGAKFKDLL